MHYKSFTVKNFRGIRDLTLELDAPPTSPIVTLVGLNESGKTTVLDALYFFYEHSSRDKEPTITPSSNTGDGDYIHSLIPKRLRDNFNETILLQATLVLDEADRKLILDICIKHGYKPSEVGNELTIEHIYHFKNSKYVEIERLWDVPVEGTKEKGRKAIEFDDKLEAWEPVLDALEERIPPIIYYPNFLFEFPDRIHLQASQKESREQKFYRRLIQDVLDSMERALNIEEHLVVRAESNDDASSEALESVINKMGSRLGAVAFDPKYSVFSHNPTTRSIRVVGPKKDPESELWYIEIKLKDGDDTFFIKERSLGFRWFFTFRIFTQFRVQRIGGSETKPLFLFDEPASNLHQTAQQRLLQAFKELANDYGAKIVYTTHSHHLIEPKWLEGTYIVRNRALSYSSHEDDAYTTAMTDISIVKYRKFVSDHPDQRTYYQPILDVLEYRPSNLEAIPEVIMVEGKNDFYALTYMNEIILDKHFDLRLLPGGGAGSLDTPIQLYYAWGLDFHVLLDSDGEGKKQKQRYREKFGKILENRLHTLEEVLPELVNGRIEELFEKDDRLEIQKSINLDTVQFHKKEFFLALQECLICHKKVVISNTSIERFRKLLHALSGMFGIVRSVQESKSKSSQHRKE